MSNEQISGAHDEQYDLISVLYHSTHGAWNYDHFIKDAEEKGDDELAGFLREVRDTNRDIASRAKRLLQARLD